MNALAHKLIARKPRQLALDICYQVIKKGSSLTRQLDLNLPQLESERDRAFCSELCFGLCRFYYVLAEHLKPLLKKPLKSRDLDIQLILMMGLYQIRFMRVENHAAVNESIKLLSTIRKNWAKGLVNAILRGYVRARDSMTADHMLILSEAEQEIAYPRWFRDRVKGDWGDLSHMILQAGNQKAQMSLRIDLAQSSRQNYLQQLAQHSIEAHIHPLIKTAIVLDRSIAVEKLPGFNRGTVSVQDASAQIAAEILDCGPGMKVLDACAAPGGKTLHIMQSAPELRVTALDQDQSRIHRVSENLNRAGLSATITCADAGAVSTWFDGELYDRILLDAPCSASGIIRRHPDIRLLRRAQDIDSLVNIQRDLLHLLWPLLKQGGIMVYSTCSIFKQENELQVLRFLEATADADELSLNPVEWGQERPAGRQILPGNHEMDGFYYARLIKSGKNTK